MGRKGELGKEEKKRSQEVIGIGGPDTNIIKVRRTPQSAERSKRKIWLRILEKKEKGTRAANLGTGKSKEDWRRGKTSLKRKKRKEGHVLSRQRREKEQGKNLT